MQALYQLSYGPWRVGTGPGSSFFDSVTPYMRTEYTFPVLAGRTSFHKNCAGIEFPDIPLQWDVVEDRFWLFVLPVFQ